MPAFIAEEAGTTDHSRTLVLTGDAAATQVRFALVRGAGLTLGEAEGTVDTAGSTKDSLTKLVGSLLAGSGADQASALAGFGVAYVLVEDPMINKVSDVLDTTPGLTKMSQDNGTALWQVTGRPATRAVITAGTALPIAVASGAESIDTTIPAGPAGRVLRLAEQADPQWKATLNGTALTRVTVDGWAQGFQLPASGGTLVVTRSSSLLHTGWIWAQLLLGITVLVLALPGRRSTKDDDLPEEVLAAAALAAAAQAQAPAPGSRRARRMAERGEGEGEQPENDPGVYGSGPGIPQQPGGEPYQAPAPEPGYDPYQQADLQQGEYQQVDPYGYDPYAAQPTYDPYAAQPPYAGEQYQAEQPYQGDPYAAQQPYQQQEYGYDPYAAQQGYPPAEQPWLPGQQPPYHPDDPSYGGGHPHHDGADPR